MTVVPGTVYTIDTVLPSSACSLATPAGSFGPDRITQIVYDAAGQVTENRVAADAAAERKLGNVISRRLRDTQSIAFTYDNLDRPTLKDLPASEPQFRGRFT